ncbi:MAG: hypothetical protein HYV09_25870 [Deltaproteobacteria bacterium]|nr:hypothetical protein [Deltaproteobacteria bacterium]
MSHQNAKDLALVLGLAPLWVSSDRMAALDRYGMATCALEIRVTPALALVPSVALVQSMARDDDRRLFFGLGLAAGSLPRFE